MACTFQIGSCCINLSSSGFTKLPRFHVSFPCLINPALPSVPASLAQGSGKLQEAASEASRARRSPGQAFALTGAAMRTMERVAVCVRMSEAVLLVGETGTGKTALVQQLAHLAGCTLTVLVS